MTRVLVADDHALVRHGLRLMIDAESDFDVVAEADDGASALEHALHDDVELAVLDVAMPRLTGIQVARRLAAHRPALPVLLVSMHDAEELFVEARHAGASGYVLKWAAHEDLIDACRAAVHGEPFVAPNGVAAPRHRDGPSRGALSPRETEVLKLIAEGESGREIGAILHISEKTVDRHRGNILDKLDLHDRVALTRYAIRRGLVEP